MSQPTNLLKNELIVDNIAATQLKETLMWANFLATILLIFSSLVALVTISGIFLSIIKWGFVEGNTTMILFLAIAIVFFFMSRFLYQFVKKNKLALRASDQESLAAAFKDLKIYFRFAGIITIVGLIFSVLAGISIMFASSFSRY